MRPPLIVIAFILRDIIRLLLVLRFVLERRGARRHPILPQLGAMHLRYRPAGDGRPLHPLEDADAGRERVGAEGALQRLFGPGPVVLRGALL